MTKKPYEQMDYSELVKLHPGDLTYIAEDLGQAQPALALPLLEQMAHHESAVVREGAAIGLYNINTAVPAELETIRRVLGVLSGDVSPAVRSVAGGFLEDL